MTGLLPDRIDPREYLGSLEEAHGDEDTSRCAMQGEATTIYQVAAETLRQFAYAVQKQLEIVHDSTKTVDERADALDAAFAIESPESLMQEIKSLVGMAKDISRGLEKVATERAVAKFLSDPNVDIAARLRAAFMEIQYQNVTPPRVPSAKTVATVARQVNDTQHVVREIQRALQMVEDAKLKRKSARYQYKYALPAARIMREQTTA